MKITFNTKAYWVGQSNRCYAGRIVGIYPENNRCLLVFDGETEGEQIAIPDLFPTKNDAVLSALKPFEENIRIIREKLAEWTNTRYKPEEREYIEIQLKKYEMAVEFLKSQLDESEVNQRKQLWHPASERPRFVQDDALLVFMNKGVSEFKTYRIFKSQIKDWESLTEDLFQWCYYSELMNAEVNHD